MKRIANNRVGALATIAVLAAFTLLLPVAAFGQFHLVFTTVRLSGPNGDSGVPRAHAGEKVDVHVEIWNLDEFFDSITINNVFLVIHHGRGDITTPNLLSNAVTLPFFGDVADISASEIVQPDDGDYLSIEYEVYGMDNWDGPGGSGVALPFSTVFGDHIRILKPALEVFYQCDVSPAYPFIAFNGVVTNTGNTPLTNVVLVSDNGTPDDTTDDSIINIGTLNPNSSAPYRGAYIATSASSRNTVTVRGTDALGLTASNSTTRTIPVTASPTLKIARSGTDAVRVSWPESAEGFRLEFSNGLGQSWTAVTDTPLASNGEFSVTLSISTIQFYRLVRP